MAPRLSLTVLGCDGSYPGPGGACSGYLVRHGATNVWVDAGSGTLARLQQHIDLEDLDAVVVTHSHPDHWTDLEGLAIAFKWALGRPGPVITAPEELRGMLRVGSAAEVFEWRPMTEAERWEVGGMTLSFSRTDHPVPTFAVRIDAGGSSVGYSADTGPGWAMSGLGPGLDVALCEATFLQDKEGTVQHLSARQAGRTAKEAGAKRLVITHLMPGVDRDLASREAEEAFGAAVTVASAGARYEL